LNSYIFELHVSKSETTKEQKYRFRVETYNKKSKNAKYCYSNDASIIFQIFKQYLTPYLNEKMYEYNLSLPDLFSGSKLLQQLACKSKIEKIDDLNYKVVEFINYIWKEAIGDLENLFGYENNSQDFNCSNFSIDQLNKAECVLLKQKEEFNKQQSNANLKDFSAEFYSILPIKIKKPITDKRTLFERYEIIQLLRDMLSINEATNWNFRTSIISKYKSVGAYIRFIEQYSSEYSNIKNDIIDSYDSKENIQILNIFEILRPDENYLYKNEMDNQRKLYHGSRVNNFTGILSRGLLTPKFVVNEMGIKRSDIGMLGYGIYFSDSLNTSLKYSHLSKTKNTRLVAICDVALGKCKDYYDYDFDLTRAPEGYDSVHGVKKNEDDKMESKFNDSEYVVYDSKQQRIRYIVELIENSDGQIKTVEVQDENCSLDTTMINELSIKIEKDEIDRLEKGKNLVELAQSGLMTNSGKNLPLKSVHVRCSLVDLVSKV
jgi:poly [ADP-ribose] polymerase 2/3/4